MNGEVLKFVHRSYALQVQDIDPQLFRGETFSANLGSVDEAQDLSEEISQQALTVNMEMLVNVTITVNTTASVRLPDSLFEQLVECGNGTVQRLSYSVFLTDVLFQSFDQDDTEIIGTIILGVRLRCAMNNTSLSMPVTVTFQTSEV